MIDELSFLSEPNMFLFEKVKEIGYNNKVLRDLVSNFNDLAHKEQVDYFYSLHKKLQFNIKIQWEGLWT